jgi:hypothetical protein
MTIHDWTRVNAGTWHDFHLAWIAELRSSLNGGCLPPDYYALAEQIIGPFGPDVLRLREVAHENWSSWAGETGGLAVKTQPPKTRVIVETDSDDYVPKRRTLVQASYSAGRTKVAYVEPTAVGKALIDMPLFYGGSLCPNPFASNLRPRLRGTA